MNSVVEKRWVCKFQATAGKSSAVYTSNIGHVSSHINCLERQDSQGDSHGISGSPMKADLDPAEWMKIGCLRQDGEAHNWKLTLEDRESLR